MSRRRERARQLAIAIAIVTLTASGCIFSPKEDPPEPPPTIDSSAALIQALADAYRQQNYDAFAGLLATDYLFVLDEMTMTGETDWDRTTELRIHQRMFDPENIPPGDPPLAAENWLQSVTISLTPEMDFIERTDLYTTADPPGTLDPTRWRAEVANYGTNVFFQLQGETDYQVTGRANFTVINDLTKQVGDAGKFQILRWEDLGTSKPTVPSV
jgi:hypothetical protein